ncbi:MAG: YihY family inner membrane protein [Pseudomonadales bacterium]|nr:YihY family inner membrane protein [Pseudomonadales bacterium]
MIQDRAEAVWDFFKLLVRNYTEDRCQSTAAALTYQTLFALVPVLTIVYAVSIAFPSLHGMGDQLQNFVFANVVPESVGVVQEYLQEFSSQARSLSIPSLGVLAITAFVMMFTIEKTFNEIWNIKEPRHGFQRILMYWAILWLGPALMLVGIGITVYLFSLPLLTDVTGTSNALALLPIFLNGLVFSLMYITVPNCVVPLRHGLMGGFVVAIAFELVKQLFGSVMSRSDMAVIYGTYAAVPLFLIWLYVSWTIVLFGAELTKNMGLFRSERSKEREPPLVQVLIILNEFFRCHKLGEVVTDKSITRLNQRIDMQNWQEYKSRLLGMGLIRSVDRGGLVLSKDLNEVTFWELYRELPWPMPPGFTVQKEAWEEVIHNKLLESYDDRRSAFDLDLERLFRGELI